MLKINFHFHIEKWKYNKQYNVYVSTDGRVKDKDGHLQQVVTNKTGYLGIKVSGKIKMLHRLVLETWKPIDNASDYTIDHLNHNKRDNSIKNLEWVSLEENRTRAVADMAKEKEIIDKTLEVVGGQINGINLSCPVVKCGNNLFYTYRDAIEFLIQKKKVPASASKKGVHNGIINSIISKKKYCGLTFELK